MCHGGEIVLVGVSGGADSVALLSVLDFLAPALHLHLHVLHVDHGLRAESSADAAFVQALCERLHLPFHLEQVAVRREAAAGSPWEGLEAEARRARLAAFRTAARRVGATRIATGHTADDQAETVLMRLLGGAGPRGLAGIAPARGPYVRPLIECRRAEIESHLRLVGLAWVEDATNQDHRFLRNRVRHDLLPYLRDAYDPAIVDSLCRGAAVARALVVDLEARARAELARLARREADALILDVQDLRRLPHDLAAETLRMAAAEQGAAGPLRASAQRALARLLGPGPVRRPAKIGRVRIDRSGRFVRVGGRVPAPVAPRRFPVPGQIRLDEVELSLEARCLQQSPTYVLPRGRDTVAFDADRLPGSLTVRARRAGDRFSPFGGLGTRRLKSFLIDAAVPRWQRERVPLLEADGQILWVVGIRRGLGAEVTAETRRILEVTVRAPLAAPTPPE